MTDERMGAALWTALARVPPGSGVVFRHHRTPATERLDLFRRVRRIAVARRLVLVAGGDALPWPVRHGGPRPTTAPAHDRGEAMAAARRGAHIVFVSPVFATRSHPGATALGARRARTVAAGIPVATIALGGMTARGWRSMRAFDGWAAIDAWLDDGETHGR